MKYLFPNRFKKMVKEESPDLQDKENGIGIEVTVAVDWRDMRAAREFANLQQGNGNIEKHKKAIAWCATRQVDNEKNIKFLCCPVCTGQYFYAANNRS